jgi:transcriptional regulator with XRE-family HTH domain
MAEPSPIVERLREALRRKNRSAYWLQQRLAEQKVTGSSIGSVSRYMRGEITPPLEFLQAATRVLGVSEPWLVCGHGSPDGVPARKDPEVHRLRALGDALDELASGWAEDDRNVEYRIADRFFSFRLLHDPTRSIVPDLFKRCGQYTQEYRYSVVPWDENQNRHGFDLELARRLGAIISGPLELLGLEDSYPPRELSPDDFNQYVLAICTAISFLLPERPDPTDEQLAERMECSSARQRSVQRYSAERERRGRSKRRSMPRKRMNRNQGSSEPKKEGGSETVA